MALTIEPGLYIRPAEDVPERYWNIGIRIEDDAIVTATGCELITRDVPVEADEIEALMQEARDGRMKRRLNRRHERRFAPTHRATPILDFDIAIVGAGPVGLALAGWLARRSATRACRSR